MPGLKGNPQAKHTTCVGRNWREWTIFFLEGQEKTMYCCKVKSTGMMSLTQSFIWGWAVERVIPSLLKKTQNNVSQWFFTNAVTVLQGLAYISLINNQNMTFKPFGVWNRNKWQTAFQEKKLTHVILKAINWSFEFGVLQLIRHQQNAPHRIMDFMNCCGTINVKFKCWFANL